MNDDLYKMLSVERFKCVNDSGASSDLISAEITSVVGV